MTYHPRDSGWDRMVTSVSVAPLHTAPDSAPDRRSSVVAEAAEAVLRDGCVLLEHVLETSFIDRLHAAFLERHAATGSSGQPRGSLRVGHQRYMITIRLRAP